MLEQGRLSQRQIQADSGARDRALPAPPPALARHRLQAQPRPPFIRDLISHGEVQGRRVPRGPRLRRCLEEPRPRRRDGLLRRRRDDQSRRRRSRRVGGTRENADTGFVTEHLAGEVRVDLTRKQVAQNGVAWKVKTRRARSAERGGRALPRQCSGGAR